MFVLLNPHISDFISEPLAFKYVKRRPLKKYSYLIDEAINAWGKVEVLADSTASGLIPVKFYLLLPLFLRQLITKIEIHYWKKRNKYSNKVVVHFSPYTIKDKSALILFAYKNYKNPAGLIKTCSNFDKNIVHLSHYHGDTKQLTETLQKIKNIYLAADADVSKAILFNHFFKWYQKQIVLFSFDVAARFKKNIPMAKRKPMAVATGTFHYIKEAAEEQTNKAVEDFYRATGALALHPLRRSLYENKQNFTNEVECLCSPYIEKGGNIFSSLLPQQLFAAQKKYFSFDIVEKYNEYRFAIVGEEYYSGLPGIGAFEAMACGAVLLAYPDCYVGMGLKEGVHYLSHNNDLSEIKNIILAEKDNIDKLEIISENAVNWIKDKMQAKDIFQRLTNQLKQLL